ncbi:hypothetical protein WICANDRAFT_36064 [Wickerhamomyces anomalus NRRL Y-366-8]|uniref:21S rRNA pseudouridine(2819) synthase n=1 Tax=Wickerhamomyces anomalus (strain ATCC 58044 / CBS 1984 / NCYC 433 / NRRL Y-366-8) TaxID=683960 RepID=A0A1E3NVL0_WICAA|nr:uncharacterized protein WICANDRAFT_36064 [Wickerhamomyces anomalus NRRL Y-366-8]ODQ57178.1 hypothetical protein WICANDRAFT_36064 [Wickerhamomyces anomalus NRRL Y-366-8]
MSVKSILPVLFENSHYIVVNKPAGIHSQHSKASLKARAQDEVVPLLIDQYPDLKPVHRLDLRVTGGLLIARGRHDARMFSNNLRSGGDKGYKFKRRYIGITRAISEFKPIENVDDPYGPFSTTKFIRPESGIREDLQLIIMQLETGKKHQIRKHLSEVLSLPIVNDKKYGSSIIRGNDQQLGLHSSFIYTRVGNQLNKHFIPIQQGADDLWKGFVNEDGYFNEDINDILENFDERLIE